MEKSLNFSLLLLGMALIVAIIGEEELDLNFQQHDYRLKFERIELVQYDKYYVKEMTVKTFKYNRTQAVYNWTLTLNIDLGYDLVWVIQAYKFMSNEYRLFPIRFAANVCKTIKANVAGMRRFFECGNFTGCPLVKGKKQLVCNMFPDEERFPPFVPTGSYKVTVQALYFSREAFVLDLYGTITRPVQWQ